MKNTRRHCKEGCMSKCATVMAMFLLCLLAGCGDQARQQAEQQADHEVSRCRRENENLRRELQELKSMIAKERQAPSHTSNEAHASAAQLEQRVKQLEYTLNRAYIDMKAALMERDDFQHRYLQAARERDALKQELEHVPGAQ